MKIVNKLLHTVIVTILAIVISVGSAVLLDTWTHSYENVSGTVVSHVMHARHKKYETYSVPYLIVNTDKFGTQEFYVNNVDYGTYKDGDRITFTHIDTDRYTNNIKNEKTTLGKIWYITKDILMFFGVGIYFLVLFIIATSSYIIIWNKEEIFKDERN